MTGPRFSRRAALRAAAVAVVGGVAGYFTARNSAAAKSRSGTTAANAYGPPTKGAATGRLASADAVPAGGGIVLEGPAIVLTRTTDGQLHAFSAVCTHQGCLVDAVHNSTITCPCHGSRFDAKTGAPTAGPASRPLTSIPVVTRDGGVYRS